MKLTINASPPIARLKSEADSMGVSFPALLTADLVRYRALAEAAAAEPALDEWEWQLLAHVMSGIEAHEILTGIDMIPSAARIAAEIDAWADSADDDDTIRAGRLRNIVAGLTPIAVAGILMRLREHP